MQTTIRKGCPVCCNDFLELLMDLGRVPRSGIFLPQPEGAYCSIGLSYEYCPRCAYIRCKISEGAVHDYVHDGRSTGHWIPVYAREIAESLKRLNIGPDAFVVEVGANDGSFLDVLRSVGYANCLGVEPSVAFAEICRSKQHQIENVYLDQIQATRIRKNYGLAQAVLCRHTLEHVPDPLGLLLSMRLLLGETGVLFIEVPDSRGIIYDLRVHELWDEHLNYFTSENLSLLLDQAGFQAHRALLKHHRTLTNILMWCKPVAVRDVPLASKAAFSSDVERCDRLVDRWGAFCRGLLADVSNWPRPIVCIGASHPQSNFLIFSGLGAHVSFLVDDDPCKVGRYVPVPQPVPVIATEQFVTDGAPGTIMRTAFGYEDWMDRILVRFASDGVRIISPYGGEPASAS